MNLYKSIFLVGFVFIALNVFSQNTISGSVKNSANESLPGVLIYFPDLKTGTTPDSFGNFRMVKLKSGSYLLDVSLVGYNTIVKDIFIEKDTVLNLEMVAAVSELNQIIITGVSRSTELKFNPLSVKTIDRNILNQSGSMNIIDGLKNIPGVNQITTGASISKPVIRGLGYNRIITLNNGIRQEGQQWGDDHGIELDEYSVDRVEIVKGPGSLMYGSDGIAGVINFLSPKALPIGEIKSQVVANFHTNNNLIGTSFSNSGNKNGVQWLGRLTNKLAGDYQNTFDGKVFNSGFRELDGTLFLGINKHWGHSQLTISSFNQILNLPEGQRDSLGRFTYINSFGKDVTASSSDYSGYHIGFPHQMINHSKLASNNYFILNNGTLNVDIGFQNNKRKEFGDPTNPGDIALYFDLTSLNSNVRYNLEKRKGWQTSIGASGMYQTNANKGMEFLIPEYHLLDEGVFMVTQKTWRKLSFSGGLRLDNRFVNSQELLLDSVGNPVKVPDANSILKFHSFSKNYNGISGSLGCAYQLGDFSTFKFNLSRGYRAPSIAELASNGRHEGTFRYELGNTNLKSEISHQLDFAYFIQTEHVVLEFTPFVNFISNYIYSEKLKADNGRDSIPVQGDPAPAYKFMSSSATLLGGEIYLDVHPHPLDFLHVENSFSFVQATQSNQPDSSKYLPFIPAPKYRFELRSQFNRVGKNITNAYVKFAINHIFTQNRVLSANSTETITPGYTLLSAGIGGNLSAFSRKDFLSLFISGENLTNVAFQNHLSRLKYAPENLATGRFGIYNMGRNISLKVIVNF